MSYSLNSKDRTKPGGSGEAAGSGPGEFGPSPVGEVYSNGEYEEEDEEDDDEDNNDEEVGDGEEGYAACASTASSGELSVKTLLLWQKFMAAPPVPLMKFTRDERKEGDDGDVAAFGNDDEEDIGGEDEDNEDDEQIVRPVDMIPSLRRSAGTRLLGFD